MSTQLSAPPRWPATTEDTAASLWPAVADPTGLLTAITDWLAGYGNYGTRHTYAQGLGLPVTAGAIADWLTAPEAGPEWAAALRAYAAVLAPRDKPAVDRRPPPAPPGQFRHLHWFRWCASQGLDPCAAETSHVKAWLGALAAAGAAVTTRDRMLGTLSALYATLAEHGAVPANPAALNRRRLGLSTAGHTASTITLTPEQVAILLATAGRTRRRGSRLLAVRARAIVALFTLGLRVTELCELDTDALHVNRGRRALRVHGKGGTIRIVYLSDLADEALADYRAARDHALGPASPPARRGQTTATHRPLLATRAGGRMSRHDIWHLLRRVAGEAGPELADLVHHMHPHVLRHFYVTTGIEAGADVADVQADVGHASIDTTRDVYDHSPRDPNRSAVDRVAAAIQQATPST